MMDAFELEIATPERSLLKAQASEAQIPGKDGYYGILAGHAPMVSRLGIGTLSYSTLDGKRNVCAVHGGFVEVKDDQVRVVADIAEPGTEIDIERAQRALQKASMALENSSEGIDPTQALAAVLRAQARLDCARQTRS